MNPQPPESREGSRALLNTLRTGFICLKIGIAILLVVYLMSGIFVVKSDEQAFVLRFGAIVGYGTDKEIIQSGTWHWAWPKPFETVIRLPVKQAKNIYTDRFWYQDDADGLAAVDTRGNDLDRPLMSGVDGYLLSADRNILHAKWSTAYLITDPVRFYAASANPEQFIRNIFESTIVHLTAGTLVRDALYSGSEQLRLEIEEAFSKRIAKANIGVVISNVSAAAREPPKSTIAAFRQVAEAEQESSESIDKARTYATKIRNEATGEQAKIFGKAEAYRQRVGAAVKADAAYFSKILEQYRRSPDTVLLTLYSQTLNDVLDKVENKYILPQAGESGSREIRLLLGPDASSSAKRDDADNY